MKGILYCAAVLLSVCCLATAKENSVLTGRVTIVDGGDVTDSSNAVIWLVPVDNDAAEMARPSPRVFRLIQRHKRFDPHLLVVPVGSVVEFPNLDPFFHNVFSLFDGKRFDLGLYEAGSNHAVRFDRPGISYIFCNIHPEMSAVVMALSTRYYGASTSSGSLIIRGVPAGQYRLQVWHERCSPDALRSLARQITVSGDPQVLGEFRLRASGELIARHKNKYDKDYIPPTPPGPFYDQP